MSDLVIPSQICIFVSFFWNLVQIYEKFCRMHENPENKQVFNGDMALLLEAVYQKSIETATTLDGVVIRLREIENTHRRHH